jgi:hypothetical protein
MFSYPEPECVATAFPVITETIPRSKLGYATNNVYPGFPPIMADGRSLIASYQPEAVLNSALIKEQGIKTNWEYRRYLTENSQSILKQNFLAAANDVGYFERFAPQGLPIPGTNTPYYYKSYLDNSAPEGYVNSDLKDMYLSREQLNSRKVAVPLTQEQIFRGQYTLP